MRLIQYLTPSTNSYLPPRSTHKYLLLPVPMAPCLAKVRFTLTHPNPRPDQNCPLALQPKISTCLCIAILVASAFRVSSLFLQNRLRLCSSLSFAPCFSPLLAPDSKRFFLYSIGALIDFLTFYSFVFIFFFSFFLLSCFSHIHLSLLSTIYPSSLLGRSDRRRFHQPFPSFCDRQTREGVHPKRIRGWGMN